MKKPHSQANVKRWYNRWHRVKRKKAWRPKEGYRAFLNALGIIQKKKLLDVGCGTGFLLQEAHVRGLSTYGVDISSEGVRIAHQVSPASTIVVGSGEKLSFPTGFFDFITCIGVLEHLSNMGRGLNEMFRVGKENARYCIVVPNKNFLYWRMLGFSGTQQQEIGETLLTLKEWSELFVKHGFEIAHVVQDTWHKDKIKIFSQSNLLAIVKNLMLTLGWFLLPLPFTYQFVFILTKKPPQKL